MYYSDVDGLARKGFPRLGAIAQLVEHLHGMQGVRSSSLLGSIEFSPLLKGELGGKLEGFDLKQTH